MDFEGKFFKTLQDIASRSSSWSGVNGRFSHAAGIMAQHASAVEDYDRLINAATKRDDYDYMELERMREEAIREQRAYRRANREYLAAQYLMSLQFDGQLNAQPFDRRDILAHLGRMHDRLTSDWEEDGTNRASMQFADPQEAGRASLLLDCLRQSYGGELGHFLKKEQDTTVVISTRAFARSFAKEFGISLGSGEGRWQAM